jgi:RimJ/RimL family protein N-acetyltransferase
MYIASGDFGEHPRIELFLLTPGGVTQYYVSWLNDPEINQFLESRFTVHTIQTTRDFVETILASPNNLFLGIRDRALGRHVGNIKLGPIDWHHETAEVGILIGDREAWGKGIASATISMATAIARSRLSLRKLTAGCYVSNVGSRRAFEKAGFVVEGIRKEQCLLNGKPEDVVLMGLRVR